ncbi:MarR family winged helix-turn-helix transcriptional regulator (plasmid) [Carnobacterium maltaromaticum]|uniref:MarR family winged helix-turn-helix transcriptional regulator n=1 Tax=Carnobacterium maltaromaticum TaxID=2751 RepID=UPI00344FB9C2
MNTAFLLLNTTRKLKHTLNLEMERYGLTAQQWAVIQRIAQTNKNEIITASQVSQFLEIDKQTLSEIIKRLEEKELIVKKRITSDRRAFSLHLSADQTNNLTIYTTASSQVLEKFLSPLTDIEKETLNHLLLKLQQERED